MASLDSLSTSTTFLDRVRQRDTEAWSRFAELYSPLVYRWARQSGLQSSDAADVVQEVFTAVARTIGSFQNDGPTASLRGWLWTITRNQVRLHFRRLKDRPAAVGGSTANHFFGQQPADEASSVLIEHGVAPASFDAQASLVHRAVQLMRQDFQPQTWQAFWRLVVDGCSVAEVAEQLGLTPGAVRQAKFRVLTRLQSELEGT
jgi:RNA polymerase sigma-70 factor (ECF subfamily)